MQKKLIFFLKVAEPVERTYDKQYSLEYMFSCFVIISMPGLTHDSLVLFVVACSRPATPPRCSFWTHVTLWQPFCGNSDQNVLTPKTPSTIFLLYSTIKSFIFCRHQISWFSVKVHFWDNFHFMDFKTLCSGTSVACFC